MKAVCDDTASQASTTDLIELGAAPWLESDTGLDEPDYLERTRCECEALIAQVLRVVGAPPPGVSFHVGWQPHDFAPYLAAVVRFDCDVVAAEYAHFCRGAIPDQWDPTARREITVSRQRRKVQP